MASKAKSRSKTPTKTVGSEVPIHRRNIDYNYIIDYFGGLGSLETSISNIVKFVEDKRAQGTPVTKSLVKYIRFLRSIHKDYSERMIGVPTYSDDVTLQYEAPKDIPVMPLQGYQWVKRRVRVEKLATGGTTAGGFYAELKGSDLNPYVATNSAYRVSEIVSWTCPKGDNAGSAEFSGVLINAQAGSQGTEVTASWSENWTRVGEGYSGIVTKYPLGAFPLFTYNETAYVISTHFTGLGGSGGVSGLPVVFDVTLECLI